jgi:hypothetical protein
MNMTNATEKIVKVPFRPNTFIRNTEKMRLQLIQSPQQDDIVSIDEFIRGLQDDVEFHAKLKGIKITAKRSKVNPEAYI